MSHGSHHLNYHLDTIIKKKINIKFHLKEFTIIKKNHSKKYYMINHRRLYIHSSIYRFSKGSEHEDLDNFYRNSSIFCFWYLYFYFLSWSWHFAIFQAWLFTIFPCVILLFFQGKWFVLIKHVPNGHMSKKEREEKELTMWYVIE